MKKLIKNVVFDASAKTITFSDYASISLERVLLITNITDGIIIYQFNDPLKGGSVLANVLTLDYDTTGMSDTDDLQIFYEDLAENISIQSDRKVLTQTNIAEPLSTVSVPCKKVEVSVLAGNTGNIAVGGTDVVVAAGSEKGMVLIAGGYQTYIIEIDDLSKVYIIGTAGDGVSYNYFN